MLKTITTIIRSTSHVWGACNESSSKLLKWGCTASICLSCVGCVNLGPDVLRASRNDYNIAIQRTNEQELLLNLVRLRYRDTIYFLNVERVASTLEHVEGISTTYVNASGGNTLNVGPVNLSIAEKPTVFYAPIDGERFAKQMMSIINPDLFILLANSGWSVERLLAITLQGMNDLRNAPTAAGPTPEQEPQYKDFRQALKYLRSLQVRRLLDVGRISAESGKSHLQLQLSPLASADQEAIEFKKLLRLDPAASTIRVQVGLDDGGKRTINVVPRSMMGILNYLSQGVDPPKSDVERRVVTTTISNSGDEFRWSDVLDGIFSVSSSSSVPVDAAVAVQYRNSWFYIRDDDLDSKSTFNLLAQLIALQAGPLANEVTPISFSISR